jgi:hypothetical protein
MKELKVTLWNGDMLSLPYVNGRYQLNSVLKHMKMLLKNDEGYAEGEVDEQS